MTENASAKFVLSTSSSSVLTNLSIISERSESHLSLIHIYRCIRDSFPGATRGAAIGHVSPEAVEGGPIAFVKDGDIIQIDITKGILNVKVSDEEMAERKKGWKPNEPKVKTGYLRRYSKLVSSAMQGAVMLDD